MRLRRNTEKRDSTLTDSKSSPPKDNSPPPSEQLPSYEQSQGQPRPSGTGGTPPNELPPDLSQRLKNLNLEHTDVFDIYALPSPDQLVAHLKLLEAFNSLREYVGTQEGLFDIPSVPEQYADDAEMLARVSEKKWAVYVARAVDRFEAWWDTIQNTLRGEPRECLDHKDLAKDKTLNKIAQEPIKLDIPKEMLPPLDVLMVWHSFTLNPRCFFEDCLRYGKLDFWVTGIPWSVIDPCIDPTDFSYSPGPEAKAHFESTTNFPWDNLHGSMTIRILCPGCTQDTEIPWTRRAGFLTAKSFNPGTGYADSDLSHTCPNCNIDITHSNLRVAKFRGDIKTLIADKVPLPGTVLESNGQPPINSASRRFVEHPDCYFPNAIMRAGLAQDVLDLTHPRRNPNASMGTVRDLIEVGVTDPELLHKAKGYRARRIAPAQRVAIRRVMSRYWFNSSPFALDLAGAVIRQGSFIDKMHNIDWLHSPALLSTMERCVTKYSRFFTIMARNPKNVAVPTLDVDLTWHTHQTLPQYYYLYSDKSTRKFIDHDDKIEETKLSSSFAWTSEAYQKMYSEPYSECRCWYCEATRESHTSTASRLFKTSNSKATEAIRNHDGEISQDPMKSPHISAHNAVKDSSTEAQRLRSLHNAQLDKSYHDACSRARKKGQPEPKRDEYFYAYAWGYPLMFPMAVYAPYGVDPCLAGGEAMYAADPCGVSTGVGAYGACAAGTCGGMAAAGGGACAGVGSGGCGGAGGSACAGGAGGGCGGIGGCGGGGGGCGGGGGGGGCGGGGGGG